MKRINRVWLWAGLLLVLQLFLLTGQRAQAEECYNLKSDFVTRDEMAKMAAENAELYLWDESGQILWHFPEVESVVEFTTEAIITKNRHDEVYVEFVQEGDMPGTGEVTVALGGDTNPFANGTEVRVYYINPITQQNELVELTVVTGGCVTFSLEHCSLYLITTVDYGASYVPDAGGVWKRVLIVAALVIGIGISIVHRRRKFSKEREAVQNGRGQKEEC